MMKRITLLLLTLLLLFAAAGAGAKSQYLAIGYGYVIAIQADGSVKALDERCDTSGWKDVIQVDGAWDHTLGLTKHGTVYAMGDNAYGQCNVEKWTDIVMVAAGAERSYGLKKDGTIVFTGRRLTKQESAWKTWRDIAWIDVSEDTLFAIDREGIAYGIGVNLNMFRDAVQIYRTTDEINVMRRTGTVYCLSRWHGYKQAFQAGAGKWTDIRELDGIDSVVTVLKGDGTVDTGSLTPYFGRWKDVVEVELYLVVTSDGEIHCASFYNLNIPEKWAELATWRVMVDPDTIPAGKPGTP